MNDFQTKLEKVKSDESWLERIKRKIPGYDGYVNRDNSREVDTMLRNQLASRLEENKTKLKNTILALSKTGKLFETNDLEKLEKKNENAIAKFKSAARGYSGAFDVLKIKDEKLKMLYEYDYSLLSYVEDVDKQFIELETKTNAKEDLTNHISQISNSLDDLLKRFDERENILRQV